MTLFPARTMGVRQPLSSLHPLQQKSRWEVEEVRFPFECGTERPTGLYGQSCTSSECLFRAKSSHRFRSQRDGMALPILCYYQPVITRLRWNSIRAEQWIISQ